MSDNILTFHLTLRNFTGGVLESATVFNRAQMATVMAEWGEYLQPGDTVTVDSDSETVE